MTELTLDNWKEQCPFRGYTGHYPIEDVDGFIEQLLTLQKKATAKTAYQHMSGIIDTEAFRKVMTGEYQIVKTSPEEKVLFDLITHENL